MKAISDLRLTILFALAVAIGCAAMSILLDHGWLLTIAYILAGAWAGHAAAHAMLARRQLPPNTSFEQFVQLHRPAPSYPAGSTRETLPPNKVFPNAPAPTKSALASVLIDPFRSMPKYQKWASAIFLFQAATGFVAIGAFWLTQGITLGTEITPVAKARFENFILPLSYIYIVSLPFFLIAFRRSLGPLVKESGTYRVQLLWAFLFLGFIASFCSSHAIGYFGRWIGYVEILGGDIRGYFFFLCMIPFFGIFLTANLPDKERFGKHQGSH